LGQFRIQQEKNRKRGRKRGQPELSDLSPRQEVSSLNLDTLRFARDLDTHRFKPAVEADRQEGNRLGVDGASLFSLNGHGIGGATGMPARKILTAP
jgi:hypothetical protein